MIEAIFFDFNGVIIDDEPLQLKVYQEVLRPAGVTFTEEDYYSSMGMDDLTFVRSAFERARQPLTAELLAALIERKTELHRKEIADELPLFPGVVTFIKAASHRYALGLVSMANRAEINFVLERARLQSSFNAVVSAEDAHTCKPDPCCYQRALELLNEQRRARRKLPLVPAECLVIEDSPPGIRAGRSAGMRTLGITNTVAAEALRAAGADVVSMSLADWTVDAVHHVFDR
jgi:beta-phosphoglucomutase